MKATISELWETRRELITFNNSDTDRPQTFAELKKCENVLIGDKIPYTRMYEVLIDNSLVMVEAVKVHHPMGGIMSILEVM
jgi:hypothetical protein